MTSSRESSVEQLTQWFLEAFQAELEGRLSYPPLIVRSEQSAADSGEELAWLRQPMAGRTEFDVFAGVSPQALLLLSGESATDPSGESAAARVLLEPAFRSLAAKLNKVRDAGVSCAELVTADHPGDARMVVFHLNREEEARIVLSFPNTSIEALNAVFENKDRAQHSDRPEPSLGILLDIELPVTISFGATEMILSDVLNLSTGSVVEMNYSISDPVDVVVNGRVVARGEVVVVDGHYGVRVSEVALRQ